jgi:hypothetical protein
MSRKFLIPLRMTSAWNFLPEKSHTDFWGDFKLLRNLASGFMV